MTPLLSMFSSARVFRGNIQSVFPARYFIFDMEAIRGGSGDTYVQLSEFNIMNGPTRLSANVYPWDLSFSPAGIGSSSTHPANETPSMANDGSTATKWLDFRGASGGLYIDLGSALPTTGYQMYTANDGEYRDPQSWKVWASKDTINWVLVSNISNQNITTSRLSYAGAWNWISGV